jgi:hypothetical protein
MTDLWLFPLLFRQDSSTKEDDDGPLNLFFGENGLESQFLIKNLGSTFIYIMIYCAILVLLAILKVLGIVSDW